MSVVLEATFAGLHILNDSKGNKRAEIELYRAISDADLAQNLERFPRITAISVDLEGEQRSDWNSLLRVIATKDNLEKVTLMDAVNEEERIAPAALVQAVLQAIPRNTSIRCVDLIWLRLPTGVSSFVDTASSITTLRLRSCCAEPAERELVATDFAAALQRNTNIKCLRFVEMDDNILFSNLLQGLGKSAHLKTLHIENTAISSILLGSATPFGIQYFHNAI